MKKPSLSVSILILCLGLLFAIAAIIENIINQSKGAIIGMVGGILMVYIAAIGIEKSLKK